MFKQISHVLNSAAKSQLLTAENILVNQLRTTFILKRRYPPRLHKKEQEPKVPNSSKFYVYDLVQATHVERQPNIDVILTTFVDGYGNVGDKVSVRPNFAYINLLLPGLAVYASPENLEKYKNYLMKEEERHSSPHAPLTVKIMGRMTLSIIMNMETPWTLKPWHVKVSFRKCGYIVSEDAITIPDQPITGPDMNIEGKSFFVTLTINNQETVKVRCRIHHWSTDLVNRIPHQPYFWEEPTEALIPEQAPILETLPERPPVKKALNKV